MQLECLQHWIPRLRILLLHFHSVLSPRHVSTALRQGKLDDILNGGGICCAGKGAKRKRFLSSPTVKIGSYSCWGLCWGFGLSFVRWWLKKHDRDIISCLPRTPPSETQPEPFFLAILSKDCYMWRAFCSGGSVASGGRWKLNIIIPYPKHSMTLASLPIPWRCFKKD